MPAARPIAPYTPAIGTAYLLIAVAVQLSSPYAAWQTKAPLSYFTGGLAFSLSVLILSFAFPFSRPLSKYLSSRALPIFVAELFVFLTVDDVLNLHERIGYGDYIALCLWLSIAGALLCFSYWERAGKAVLSAIWVGVSLHGLAVLADFTDSAIPAPGGISLDELGWSREMFQLLGLGFYFLSLVLMHEDRFMVLSAATGPRDRKGATVEGGAETTSWFNLHDLASGATRALAIMLGRVHFFFWRLRHSSPQYASYYAAVSTAQINLGLRHRTLGVKFARRKPDDWTPRIMKYLLANGLAPHHLCVDFGCGSLRIGYPLIRYLDPGNYHGIDITDRFYRDGIELMDPAVICSKQPHLDVIDDRVLGQLSRNPPDIVLSSAVIQHIPPHELGRYFERVSRLIGPRTRAFLFFDEMPQPTQTAWTSWAYPAAILTNQINRLCPRSKTEIRRFKKKSRLFKSVSTQSVMIVTGTSAG